MKFVGLIKLIVVSLLLVTLVLTAKNSPKDSKDSGDYHYLGTSLMIGAALGCLGIG